ncbi:MAG: response regulator transcription factor [Pseudomonadota bacterium]
MRILIVEDEARLAEDIARALGAVGFVTEHASDGEEASFLCETEDYAAVILDLGLPGLDGLSVLKRLRSAGIDTPVVILTARSSWTERVDGIDAGADDYLVKPFQMEELIARLHAVMRRSAGKASSQVTIGPVVLDARRMQVSVDGTPVSLTPLEYRALAFLIYNSGRVVPPHELGEHVYGVDGLKEANTLEVLIGRLRRKLGVPVVQTRRGYGYIIEETP